MLNRNKRPCPSVKHPPASFTAIAAFIFICIILTGNSKSQAITWQKTYGGPGIDEGYSIVETPDSGYIAVGRKRISPFEYMNVFRLNKFGDVIWNKLYPGIWAEEIERTHDNNYIIMSDHILMKINIDGDTLWRKGPFDYNKHFSSIRELSSGTFIICGTRDIGIRIYPLLFKVSSSGDSIWEKTYTEDIFEGVFSEVVISNENNFVVCGNITDSSFTGNDKLSIGFADTNGNLIRLNWYDSLQYSYAESICKTLDSGFIIGGGGGVASLSKINSSGDIQWLRRYDTNLNSLCRSVINTIEGNTVYTGYWDTSGTLDFCVRLRKVDNVGTEIWRRSFGFSGDEHAWKVRQTSDSGFIIMAFTDYGAGFYDMFIIKTDKNGNSAPYIGIEPFSTIIPNKLEFRGNYPNPFNPVTKLEFDIPHQSTVSLIIYDILGREVERLVNETLEAAEYSIDFNARSLPSGIYFARLTASSDNNTYTKTQKLVLVK